MDAAASLDSACQQQDSADAAHAWPAVCRGRCYAAWPPARCPPRLLQLRCTPSSSARRAAPRRACRPQKGQLGLGDTINRNNPTVVEGLRNKKIVAGSAGKSHSAVVTATGESYTFGLNQYGQLGTGQVKKLKGAEDMSLTPQLVRRRRAGGVGGVGGGVRRGLRLQARAWCMPLAASLPARLAPSHPTVSTHPHTHTHAGAGVQVRQGGVRRGLHDVAVRRQAVVGGVPAVRPAGPRHRPLVQRRRQQREDGV